MVQCEFCLHYNSFECTEPNGVKYGQDIVDPYENIDCPAYLEKGAAGALSPAVDDIFFDMF
jgi:hypothetical protein